MPLKYILVQRKKHGSSLDKKQMLVLFSHSKNPAKMLFWFLLICLRSLFGFHKVKIDHLEKSLQLQDTRIELSNIQV